MNEIVYYSTKLFHFLLSFFLIVLVLSLLFSIVLKKYNPKGKKLKIYGLFLGLSNKDIASLALITVRYIFFIWCLFNNDYVRIDQDINFYILLISNLGFDLINQRYLNIIPNIINNGIIYVALFCKMMFIEYLETINMIWYIMIIVVLLIIFTMAYGSYFFVKDIDYLLKENKHIKKKIKTRRKSE